MRLSPQLRFGPNSRVYDAKTGFEFAIKAPLIAATPLLRKTV
jgi:hypothetical protein